MQRHDHHHVDRNLDFANRYTVIAFDCAHRRHVAEWQHFNWHRRVELAEELRLLLAVRNQLKDTALFLLVNTSMHVCAFTPMSTLKNL